MSKKQRWGHTFTNNLYPTATFMGVVVMSVNFLWWVCTGIVVLIQALKSRLAELRRIFNVDFS
jgi:hypothetical protein